VRIRGSGRGNPVGAPLEAVVADLCSTRKELAALLTQIVQMRADNERTAATMIALLTEIRDEMREGRDEAVRFRGDMAALRASAVELREEGGRLKVALERGDRAPA
jgi:hypothetical protein